MLVEDCLYATLRAAPALSSMPIRPNVAEAGDIAPYIVYTKVTGQRVKSLLGDSGLANPLFQIDVYAADAVQAATLHAAIRVAVLSSPQLGAVHRDEGSGYETETKLHRCRQDFSLWFYD